MYLNSRSIFLFWGHLAVVLFEMLASGTQLLYPAAHVLAVFNSTPIKNNAFLGISDIIEFQTEKKTS